MFISRDNQYANKFKYQMAKQPVVRKPSINEVVERLGVCIKRLYQWRLYKYSMVYAAVSGYINELPLSD